MASSTATKLLACLGRLGGCVVGGKMDVLRGGKARREGGFFAFWCFLERYFFTDVTLVIGKRF